MARLEDLKTTWQSQRGISEERFEQIGEKVRAGTSLLQSTIFRRDMAESFAAFVVVAFFSPGLFTAKNWIAWSGFAIVVLAAVTIPLVLAWARKRSIKTLTSANFCDFVDIEIDYLRRQVQLLRNVTWWYLLPLYIGILLLTIGLTDPVRDPLFVRIFLAVYMLFCTVLVVYIWWLNQSARKRHLEPLLDYYIQMREAVQSGDDFSLQVEGPPTAFLERNPRPPISRRRKQYSIALTILATAAVAGAGIATMYSFDRRTGIFVTAASPVVALLLIHISGVWRRDPG